MADNTNVSAKKRAFLKYILLLSLIMLLPIYGIAVAGDVSIIGKIIKYLLIVQLILIIALKLSNERVRFTSFGFAFDEFGEPFPYNYRTIIILMYIIFVIFGVLNLVYFQKA